MGRAAGRRRLPRRRGRGGAALGHARYALCRTALIDLEIAGQKIRAGDIVTLWNTSANDDETVFPDPRTFDLARKSSKHLTFGHGPTSASVRFWAGRNCGPCCPRSRGRCVQSS
ncbi:cytochrome P450 [Amycolatopsis plumensis]|uniref:cytochrome P450 n=1 Tax=Amycolatopsis plumensis TaxID=236508 RepID=UPI0036091973